MFPFYYAIFCFIAVLPLFNVVTGSKSRRCKKCTDIYLN